MNVLAPRFFVTAHKGYQTICEHVDSADLAAHLAMLSSKGFALDNVERIDSGHSPHLASVQGAAP